MSRVQKGNMVARYFTGHSAIPGIRYEGSGGRLEAPWPYLIHVMTDRRTWRFMEHVAQMQPGSMSAVIRFDKYIESVDAAVVGMRLDTFSQLAAIHYETQIRPRQEGNERK